MDCDRVAKEEILERYLRESLNEQDRDAFEEHYFGCGRCFDELQTLRVIRQELQRAGADSETAATRPFLRWEAIAGLAAAVVLAVGVAVLRSPVTSDPREATAPVQSTGQVPEKPALQEPQPTVAPEPSVEQLARFDPPRHQPLTLRGAPDQATARFQRAMGRYRKGDYKGAVADLSDVAELDPEAAHVRFYLGISHLMLGQDLTAIDQLRATIAIGDSPYLEEAHWYLAKALLRRKDLGGAEIELRKLIQLRGSGNGEARQLLTQLERLKDRSH